MAEGTSSLGAMKRSESFSQTDTMRYRAAFDKYDTTLSGLIDADDVIKAAAKLSYKISEAQLEDMLTNNKLDKTSKLSFEQFLDVLPRNMSEITKEQHRLAELRDKFQRYDQDKNGFINLNEAQWALQLEMDVSPQTALRLLNKFIKLNYEQFVEFYENVQGAKMEIYDKFGKYDQDHDGMISAEEAHRILHQELGFKEEKSRAMVNHFDRNKDGFVSYVEFAEFYIAVEERKSRIRQAFKEFDTEDEGFVSTDQACTILQGYLGFSEAKAKQTVELHDKNKDNIIDYEEFVEFFSMIEEERQRLLTEFSKYDSDGDGKISLQEFTDMLTSQGYSERDIKTLMTGYDEDQDGCLSFDEFRRFLNFS